jgi:hypothetical protein
MMGICKITMIRYELKFQQIKVAISYGLKNKLYK